MIFLLFLAFSFLVLGEVIQEPQKVTAPKQQQQDVKYGGPLLCGEGDDVFECTTTITPEIEK